MLQPVSAEPLLVSVLVASVLGGGALIGAQLRTALKTLERLTKRADRTEIALYGDEMDPRPNGLKRAVGRIDDRLEEHIVAVQEGRAEQRIFNDGFTQALGEHHKILGELLERRKQERTP